MMNVVFRTDASTSIGSGHVMRCLSLADALKIRGAECYFICTQESGHALDFIRSRGHAAYALPRDDRCAPGVDCSRDAAQTRAIVTKLKPEWLIVDPYLLGQEWECQIRSAVNKLLVKFGS